jgi:hypothetical protein
MKITVERSGGFAGISSTFFADENTLSLSEKQEIEKLLEGSKSFKMASESPSHSIEDEDDKRGADYFVYRITIEKDPGKSYMIETNDMKMDSSLKSIIAMLESKQR